jgi:endonuclease G
MIMIRKHIIFSLIGLAAVIPMSSEAKESLLNLAEHAFKAHKVAKYAEHADVQLSNSGESSTKAENLRTPNLCPQHYPLGAPLIVLGDIDKVARRSFYLCEQTYAVQFDPQTKTPLWVAEHLIGAQQAEGHAERVDNFQPHPVVPKPAQAALSDYRGSKFDRGHMAPAADMPDDYSMNQSFFLTNMIPQVGPNMNRGIWADLEAVVRKWSINRGEVLVITGPIFGQGYQVMGKSQVWVPTHLYKVVLDPKTNESVAFIMPNVQVVTRKTHSLDQGNPDFPQTTPESAVNCSRTCIIDDFIVPLSSVEQATGIQFFPKLNPQQKQQASQKGRMWSAR